MNDARVVALVLAADFVRQVRVRQRELGISRVELARRVGRFPSVVSRDMYRGHLPTLETIVAYARALQCEAVLELQPVLRVRLVPVEAARAAA